MAISEDDFLSVCRQLAEAVKSSQKANARLDEIGEVCDFDSPGAPQDIIPYIQWLKGQVAGANAARERAEAKCADAESWATAETRRHNEAVSRLQSLLDKLARAEALIATYRKLKEQAREFGNHDLAETYRTIQEELEQALKGEPHA